VVNVCIRSSVRLESPDLRCSAHQIRNKTPNLENISMNLPDFSSDLAVCNCQTGVADGIIERWRDGAESPFQVTD
jgi:hypothetical protein